MKIRMQGSVLIAIMALSVLIGGTVLALSHLCMAYHRGSSAALDHDLAVRAAESGLGYFMGQLSTDAGYFGSNPAPHALRAVGTGSFVLESAVAGSSADEWDLTIKGSHGESHYRLEATVGHRRIRFPPGIAVAGSGSSSAEVVTIDNGGTVASYDPTIGPFDPIAPGDEVALVVNGSVRMEDVSSIHGDVTATGTFTDDDGTCTVTGTITESAPEASIDDVESFALEAANASRVANDNAALAGIFGSEWTPVSGSENYGDLIVSGGSYVVPAGTYRFRRFEIRDGATVTFDTSAGPTTLVHIGTGSGSGDDFQVANGSSVVVAPSGTTNALTAILDEDADFLVTSNSVYGRGSGSFFESNSAGFSRIVSLGGDGSADRVDAQSGSRIYGQLHARAHDLTVAGDSIWYGSAVVQSLAVSDGLSAFAVDEAAAALTVTDPSSYEVLAVWRAADQSE